MNLSNSVAFSGTAAAAADNAQAACGICHSDLAARAAYPSTRGGTLRQHAGGFFGFFGDDGRSLDAVFASAAGQQRLHAAAFGCDPGHGTAITVFGITDTVVWTRSRLQSHRR